MKKTHKNLKRKDRYPKENDVPYEKKELEDIAFGFYSVTEALENGRGNKLFIADHAKGTRIQTLKEVAQAKNVPIQWVPKERLDELSEGEKHQDVVLRVTPFQYWELHDLIEKSKSEENPLILILDGVTDPHNLGSILRTADASGVCGVIIPKHRSAGVSSVVTKISTGAAEYVPVVRVTNLVQTAKLLKEHDFWLYGTDMAGKNYTEWNTQGSIALVIGSEGSGISQGLKKEMDEMLTIPMTGHVQSLNASVAAGILMYEAFRKRK